VMRKDCVTKITKEAGLWLKLSHSEMHNINTKGAER